MSTKPLFSETLVRGTFDWVGDNYSAIIVDNTYTSYSSHEYLSQVTGRRGNKVPLTGKQIQTHAGTPYCLADQTISFGVISGGATLNAVIIVRDTGVEATSFLCVQLSAFQVTGLPYATTGNDVDLEFDDFVGIVAGKGAIMNAGSS